MSARTRNSSHFALLENCVPRASLFSIWCGFYHSLIYAKQNISPSSPNIANGSEECRIWRVPVTRGTRVLSLICTNSPSLAGRRRRSIFRITAPWWNSTSPGWVSCCGQNVVQLWVQGWDPKVPLPHLSQFLRQPSPAPTRASHHSSQTERDFWGEEHGGSGMEAAVDHKPLSYFLVWVAWFVQWCQLASGCLQSAGRMCAGLSHCIICSCYIFRLLLPWQNIQWQYICPQAFEGLFLPHGRAPIVWDSASL